MSQSSLKSKLFKLTFCAILGMVKFGYCQTKHWEKMPFRINRTPCFIYPDSTTNQMLVGGEFDKVNFGKCNLFFWDNNQLTYFYSPELFNVQPVSAIRFGNKLYSGCMGGLFVYDNNQWTKCKMLGESNGIWSFYNYHGKLLVGGVFVDIPPPPYNKYAPMNEFKDGEWKTFNGLDTILFGNFYVNAITEYNGELYLGGNFDGQGSMKEIIKWDGYKWSDVGGGILGGGMEVVDDMVVYKGELYVAGFFCNRYGSSYNFIQRWNGENWKSVGGGVDGEVFDMQIFNDELWIAGEFKNAGGIRANSIAKWDGKKWFGLGSNFDNGNTCLGVYKNELYVGGGFWSIDGDTAISFMAKWTGGNYYDTSGNLEDTAWLHPSFEGVYNLFPNPVNDLLNITLSNQFETDNFLQLDIYNTTGQLIMAKYIWNPNNKININVSDLASGVYIVELQLDENRYRKRFVKY